MLVILALAGCSASSSEPDQVAKISATTAPEPELVPLTIQLNGAPLYPAVIGDGVPFPAFSEKDLESWAKLNFTTVVVLKAQGKLPTTYPDTGACTSFYPHIESLFGNGWGIDTHPSLAQAGNGSTLFGDGDSPINWWSKQSAKIQPLLIEVAVLCPGKYPSLIDALSSPKKYQFSLAELGVCTDYEVQIDKCEPKAMIDFVEVFLTDNPDFFESRTGSKALLGVEPPTPWTSMYGVFFIESLWLSCQLRNQISLPPTTEDVKKLRQAAKSLRNAYEETDDEYFLSQSQLPLSIVEYYVKYPDDQYSPFSLELWRAACEDNRLAWQFTYFGLK